MCTSGPIQPALTNLIPKTDFPFTSCNFSRQHAYSQEMGNYQSQTKTMAEEEHQKQAAVGVHSNRFSEIETSQNMAKRN